MKPWCVECARLADEVEHGTPPVFSDHTYIDVDEICRRLGHLRLSTTGDACVRCAASLRGDEPVTPSEAIKAGLCPCCMGTGRVDRCVPYEDVYPCSTCGGSGKWPSGETTP